MLATGEVTLQTVCVVGQTETIQAFVTDQGTYPGPLSGIPTTITFTCNVSTSLCRSLTAVGTWVSYLASLQPPPSPAR